MFILFRSAQEPVVSGIDSNYIKISTLLLRIAPRAVRIKFDELFSPEVLKEVLKSNLIKISNLKTCRSINQEQWNSMFPKTGMMSRFFLYMIILVLGHYIPFTYSMCMGSNIYEIQLL